MPVILVYDVVQFASTHFLIGNGAEQVQEAMKPHAVKLYHAVESVNTTHLYVKVWPAMRFQQE